MNKLLMKKTEDITYDDVLDIGFWFCTTCGMYGGILQKQMRVCRKCGEDEFVRTPQYIPKEQVIKYIYGVMKKKGGG